MPSRERMTAIESVVGCDRDRDDVPPPRIGHPKRGSFAHAWGRCEYRLDLRRMDVLAAADDDVVRATEEVHGIAFAKSEVRGHELRRDRDREWFVFAAGERPGERARARLG